jgi:anti-anti-sigma factor
MDNEFRLISRISEAGVVHVEIHGDLDAATADRLLNVLGVYREPITGCVIDFAHCDFIDSYGVRALVLCQMQLGLPQRLMVVGLRDSLAGMLSLAGIESMFDIWPACEPA